ncbi:MAG: DUF2156 domain-containing protein, partial [Actinobacteria bacterium]|nr:DUF2156 domain-containing protein [Actinomycetota bacterium]
MTDEDAVDEAPLVPDAVTVEVPAGGRLIVMADLRLRRVKSETAVALSNELARVIEAVNGPCVLVLAGDTFDLAADAQLDPGPVMATHQRFSEAVAALAADQQGRVILLPGSRDASLAWHRQGVEAVRKRLGAEVALTVDTEILTGAGLRRVRVESGARFDPLDARSDPRNSAVRTLADHARRIVENLGEAGDGWLDGVEFVADPTRASAFVAGRLFHRKLIRRFGWLALPLLAAIPALVVGIITRLSGHRALARTIDAWAAGLAIAGVAIVTLSALLSVIWWWILRDPLRAVSIRGIAGVDDDVEPNDAARSAAGRLVEEGLTGLITGHTAEAELSALGPGFYANAGTCGPLATTREGRFGVPDVWVVEDRWSWIEVEAGADVAVRLNLARRQPPTTTLTERLLGRRQSEVSGRAEIVAAWPSGNDWPVPVPIDGARRRARRIGSLAIAIAGAMNLASAVIPPFHDRLEAVRDFVPLAISQAAAMVVALAGLLLLLLARGVRRGQRHAWVLAEITLAASFVLHVVKGLDLEEAIIAASTALYLLAKRRHFRVKADDRSVGRGLVVLVGGLTIAIVTATLSIKLIPGHRHKFLSWGQAFQASAERLVGITDIRIGGRMEQFMGPVMIAIAVGLVLYAGWIIFGPVVGRRLEAPEPADAERAREIIERSNGGTLAYFALRDDKRWFFWGNTLVAYAVSQGVALVSPDPIGPVVERRRAWFAFRHFADSHGWPIAVMGASEEWLPIYRSSGMRDMYVGDEAIVDVQRFSLDGPRNKAVRQAVNRVANKGYTIEFDDPAKLDPALEAELRGLMTESRRGEMERGFSMTLGRVFDPRDTGLLLAVCRNGEGRPVAFCQFVPAPGIGGFSLDLMRRSESADHPNGLTDFVVASTMGHLKEQGYSGLALNFATMRATLAGERGEGTQRRLERWMYRKMGDSMQIESLWRYNAKFDPDW